MMVKKLMLIIVSLSVFMNSYAIKIVGPNNEDRLFDAYILGVKFGLVKPLHIDKSFQELVNIGFNMKTEAEKFFLEYGMSALLPSRLETYQPKVGYGIGGITFEIGTAFYLTRSPLVSFFVGGGLNPRILFTNNQVLIVPYITGGVMLFQNASTCAYINLRIGQNISNLHFREVYYYVDNTTVETKSFDARPFELGFEFGIGW